MSNAMGFVCSSRSRTIRIAAVMGVARIDCYNISSLCSGVLSPLLLGFITLSRPSFAFVRPLVSARCKVRPGRRDNYRLLGVMIHIPQEDPRSFGTRSQEGEPPSWNLCFVLSPRIPLDVSEETYRTCAPTFNFPCSINKSVM